MNDSTLDPYTKIPNDWIDRAMPSMSAAEWMIMTVILRQTAGWHKERDAISLTQFEQRTGLSRHTVIAALRNLAQRGWIVIYEQGNRSIYEPRFSPSAKTAPLTSSAEIAPELVQKLHHASAKTAPEVVQKLHTQKKERKKKEKKETLTRAARGVSPSQPISDNDSEEAPMSDTPAKREHTPYGDLFIKIANVCRIDPKIGKHAKQISSTAKYLEARGVTPDLIDAFAAWWRANDFRGQRGEYTSPSYIAQYWLQFEEFSASAPASMPPAPSRYTTKQTSKSGTYRHAQSALTDAQRAAAEAEAARMLRELGDEQ